MKYVLLLVVCVVVPSAAAAQDDKASVLAKALASRKALPKQYHIVLTESDSVGPNKPHHQFREISVWSKNDALRTDAFKKSSSFDPGGVGWREITCRNCERPGYAIKTRAGGGTSLVVADFSKLDAAFDAADYWRIDWRGLGLLQDSLDGYAKEPYTQTLDLLAVHANDAAEVKPLNGFPCLVLTSIPKGDVRLTRTCWFRPDLGMNPVLCEDAASDWDFKKRTEVEYRKVGNLDAWYPSSVRHTRTQGGRLVFDEKLSVLLADFESPVADSVFTLDVRF